MPLALYFGGQSGLEIRMKNVNSENRPLSVLLHPEVDQFNKPRFMKQYRTLPLLFLLTICLQLPCMGGDSPLLAARQNFHTKLLPQKTEKIPVDIPPAKLFLLAKYPSASGPLVAYLTSDPGDHKKHPAILWITGGDCNSIGDVWSTAPRENDQTAAAYRQAGIVMMFPSLRGGNDNPGIKEGFLGEADDVLAAAKFLQQQPYVDPARIYLGGHSTGGTLVLLVAESSPLFRAVFAFGPVGNVASYGADSGFIPVDLNDRQEIRLRSPGNWLGYIQSPTWVLEGTGGNITQLRAMAKTSTNAKVQFVEIKGSSHFATLAPINELIAQKILQDTSGECNITLPADEVNRRFATAKTLKP